MRISIVTDAWHPQINGVVRSLEEVAKRLPELGAEAVFLTPGGFRNIGLPTYPDIRIALTTTAELGRRIEALAADCIHIATEGPLGILARRYCMKRGRVFTTSYHTRFPEYIAARVPVPKRWVEDMMRRFHASARATMVSTRSLEDDLRRQGYERLTRWPRGVDAALFHPRRARPLALPRPIFLSVGRVAVEKNLEAFLSLDLPGSKVVAGDGPARATLQAQFPGAHFMGALEGEALAEIYASADVFVFPSRTDTFGNVMLEALSSGVPVAAYPVPGPLDVVGEAPVGRLDEDLRAAALGALSVSRAACRQFALGFSWAASARQFCDNIRAANGMGEMRAARGLAA